MPGKELTQDWVSQSKKDNPGLFSELDMLLRALDRYFSLENLPASTEDIAVRNFYEELVIARDTILRVLGILEAVIPENKRTHTGSRNSPRQNTSRPKRSTLSGKTFTVRTRRKKGCICSIIPLSA